MNCIATTTKGLKCKRTAKIGDYCTQHYNILNKSSDTKIPEHKIDTPEIIYFYDIKEEYGYYSNFSPYSVVIEGIKYQTVEHYFQSQKFTDSWYRELIKNANTPGIARLLAHQEIGGGYKWRTDLNPYIQKSIDQEIKWIENWENIKLDIMYVGIYAKFTQHLDLQQKLLDTGNAEIAENSPRDNYWGIGKNRDGQNHLGRLLMKLRDELRGNALVQNIKLIENKP